MNYRRGNQRDNEFKGTSGSDEFHGLGGDDSFSSNMDASSPYAMDRFYGGAGNDDFWFTLNSRVVDALRSGELAKPVVVGDTGRDTLSMSLDRVEVHDLADLKGLFEVKGIEQYYYDIWNASGEITGTKRDEVVIALGKHDAQVDGKGGNDTLAAFSSGQKLVVHGGSGKDILTGNSEGDGPMPELFGDGGRDYFVVETGKPYHSQSYDYDPTVRIMDFDAASDRIVFRVSLGWHYEDWWQYGDDLDPRHSEKHAEHVSYDADTGRLRYHNYVVAIIEGAPDLDVKDFLFV